MFSDVYLRGITIGQNGHGMQMRNLMMTVCSGLPADRKHTGKTENTP
jgi:hypothetical protein